MAGNAPSHVPCSVFCLYDLQRNPATLSGKQTFGHLSVREISLISGFQCEIAGIDGQTVVEYGDLCSRGEEELRAGSSLCNYPPDMAFRILQAMSAG